MSINDYSKRVKHLVNRAYNIEVREGKLTRKSTIYHEKVGKLQECIKKNIILLESDHKLSQKFDESNRKLKRFINSETEANALVLKERNAKMENNTKATAVSTPPSLAFRKNMFDQMDAAHCLKLLTGILAKPRESSNIVNGVVVCNGKTTTKWSAFHFDLSKQSNAQIQYNVWRILVSDDENANTSFLNLLL